MSMVPESYRRMDLGALRERIREKKRALGSRLVILGHHYQRQDVIDFADFRGDSLALCRRAAAQEECEFVVFCGVRFMAESAEILRKDHQRVQHPDPRAGCPLAEMADLPSVRLAWEIVSKASDGVEIIPVTYMNSGADLKAFCGRRGGAVCTSSNASAAFEWVRVQGAKLFFFPDENLGRNTAKDLHIDPGEILVWDPEISPGNQEIEQEIRRAKVILWKGFCHVHTQFQVEQIEKIRGEEPDAKIVVHPECSEEVVAAADAVGSTEYICRYVKEASPGALVYVGTELNLVERLARTYPDKRIFELSRSLCPNMFRIDLPKLLWCLDGIGEVNRVIVDPETKEFARLALQRMLRFA